MGLSYAAALSGLEAAAEQIVEADRRVHAVGIEEDDEGDGFRYRAVRNFRRIVAQAFALRETLGVPVRYVDALHDAAPLLKLPASGPGSPAAASLIPEQRSHRPLVCGLQIQNFDDDDRQGVLAKGFIIIGTLGCFVSQNGDSTNRYFLSNNHVVAGENRGQKGRDRILQPGSGQPFPGAQHAATLHDYAAIRFSAANATPQTAVYNDIDAGIARIEAGVQGGTSNGYLPSRHLPILSSATATAQRNDRVYKVGRTTGLTRGTVTSAVTIVGPIDYAGQDAWFRGSLEIEGDSGTLFSDHGDSGSAIVLESTNEIVALLYAGNGSQTYACPIDKVLQALNCTAV